MRKNRSIAGFGDVASEANINVNDNDNKNVNENINENINENVNININDIIGEIEVEQKKLIGIYFEPRVAEVLKDLASKGGKGVKGIQSKIVNEALKKLFREKGLM